MKKLVLVLTTFLVAPAHADTVTIGWWDKSIGGPVSTLSATTPTSPIVDVIAHPLLLGRGFGFAQLVAMVIPPTGNIISGGLAGSAPTFQSRSSGFLITAAATSPATQRSFAREIGLEPRTTPLESPQSNGMAEAFVRTIKRDYVRVSPRPDAKTVMRQLPAWIAHYNEVHPHKALGYRSPREFIAAHARR